MATGTRVFISYVREDSAAAQRLYQDLRREGFSPWIDTESLRPGEDWRDAISIAIQDSTYFIALLSTQSVAKRGYAQRELRTALEMLPEIPSGEVFLIPARLEPCEIRDPRLSRLHRIDMYPSWEKALGKIVAAMRPAVVKAPLPQLPAVPNQCANCLSPVGFDDERCKTCGRELTPPNVRHALMEQAALDERYRAALRAADARGQSGAVVDLGDLPACVALSVASALRFFSGEEPLFATWYLSGSRASEQHQRVREVIDIALFPGYGRKVTFGFVPLSEDLLTNYGPITLVLAEEFIAHRISVIERSSFELTQLNLGQPLPQGLRSVWSERHKLATIRLAQDKDNMEPLECQIFGGIAPRSVRHAVISSSHQDGVMLRELLERLRRHGLPYTIQNGVAPV